MSPSFEDLSVEEALLILQFWAQGQSISQRVSQEKLRAIPGLAQAIAASSRLPEQIGWDGNERSQAAGLNKR